MNFIRNTPLRLMSSAGTITRPCGHKPTQSRPFPVYGFAGSWVGGRGPPGGVTGHVPSARLADADSPVVERRIFATPDGDAVELLIEQPAAASATHAIRSTLRMLYLALGSSEQAIVPQAP